MWIIVNKDNTIPIYVGPYDTEDDAHTDAVSLYGLRKFEIVMLIPVP